MIKKVLHSIFQVIFLMVFFWIYILMLEKMALSQEIPAIVLSLLLLGFLCFIYRHLHFKYMMPVVLTMMTALLIYCGFTMQFTPVADLGNLYKMAQNFAMTGSMKHIYDGMKFKYYLSVYPNNDLLFLIIAGYFRIIYLLTGIVPQTIAGILLNIVVIDLSYYLTYRLAEELLDDHSAQFVCLLFALFSPFYFYVTFYYTDTFAMPWMLLSLLLFIKGGRKNLLISLFCAFLAYKMKGNMLLIVAVMIIYTCLTKPWKETLIYIMICALMMFTLSKGFNFIINQSGISSPQLEEKYKMPLAHWIGMSLIGDGGYRRDDFKEIKRAGNYEEKNKKSIQRIKTRLNHYSLSAFYDHCKNKVSYTWCDGTYFAVNQTYYYPLVHDAVLHPETQIHKLMTTNFYRCYADMYQCMILLCFILYGFSHKASIEPMLIIQGMLLGAFCFFLLWETRSRYILSLVPLMLILSTSTIQKISSCLFSHNSL